MSRLCSAIRIVALLLSAVVLAGCCHPAPVGMGPPRCHPCSPHPAPSGFVAPWNDLANGTAIELSYLARELDCAVARSPLKTPPGMPDPLTEDGLYFHPPYPAMPSVPSAP